MPDLLKPKHLNLGCGLRCHPQWVNIDHAPRVEGVIAHDLTRGIPAADGECAVVYHSHVLEHFKSEPALAFLSECLRVLEPGGVLRVAVPDLEAMCRTYLDALERAATGEPGAQDDHRWMTLEIVDQLAREDDGGDMTRYLLQDPLPNPDFIFSRIGLEGRRMVRDMHRRRSEAPPPPGPGASRLAYWLGDPSSVGSKLKAKLISDWLGPEGMAALELGRFRSKGEVHYFVYDRVSLARLLESAGFAEVEVASATTSRIPQWGRFLLDADESGKVYKPDSLFMEATKPAGNGSERTQDGTQA